jgi:hypothetical protein
VNKTAGTSSEGDADEDKLLNDRVRQEAKKDANVVV